MPVKRNGIAELGKTMTKVKVRPSSPDGIALQPGSASIADSLKRPTRESRA
jgi:hypothetical protein